MVEEARQKSSGVPSDTKSSPPTKTSDSKADSQSNQAMNNQTQGSHSHHEGSVNSYPYPHQPQLWTGAPGVPPPGYGLNYTLLQPGMLSVPPPPAVHSGLTFSSVPQVSNETLFQLMQAQTPGGSYITSYPTPASFNTFPLQAPSSAPHGHWRGEPTYQDPVLSALQREQVFQDQLNAARAANAPVAFTILSPGSAEHQMLRQVLERDRLARDGSSRGAPTRNYRHQYPPGQD